MIIQLEHLVRHLCVSMIHVQVVFVFSTATAMLENGALFGNEPKYVESAIQLTRILGIVEVQILLVFISESFLPDDLVLHFAELQRHF